MNAVTGIVTALSEKVYRYIEGIGAIGQVVYRKFMEPFIIDFNLAHNAIK